MKRKKSMTRDEAAALYDNLQAAMNKWMATKKGSPGAAAQKTARAKAAPAGAAGKKVDAAEIAAIISQGLSPSPSGAHARTGAPAGRTAAVLLVLAVAAVKLALSAVEATGLAGVKTAEATLLQPSTAPVSVAQQGYSQSERQVLTALDARRAALEERNRRLDERALDLEKRDREFAARLTEIRELTNRLRVDRDKNEKQKNEQLNQLSKVYAAMSPSEAAPLIEQLDVTIGLALLQRMSEKRIAQILALMAADRALMLTRMLSGGK